MEPVLTEWKGNVAIVTINRPEVYNALNKAALEALSALVGELGNQPRVRALVITGAGEKAFCAGADLKERRAMSQQEVRRYLRLIRDTFTRIEQMPKPVIAAVNGVALGGGTELALACDLRVAEETATLGLTETSLGIIPGAGGTQRLPRLIGKAKAKELIFTAQKITATDAERWGLVNKVVSKGKGLEAALAWAGQIAENAPLALEQAKFAINQGVETELATGLALETKAYETLIPTKDRLEGLAAFKERRKPRYTGE
ncbi:enoyl-CoA hydratase-related protein [Thermoactinomyces mirandus]|uniref:Enoyl-CoA hydratase/isomerase family protein n=1 Tax=Thermoactinomyces mirandus TaxID=2756294 RepID=A0A7W2AQD0_9BACL|nr:enoyl-CoA hydratase-related protein [Thermoactinomyces mirandus]MBA4601177.1 enoyl-CoA hydratase/isomerase family protein [Thermoactinomyces mirandus]